MAVLASKASVTVTLSPGETLNVIKGGQGVGILKGGQFKGQSFELGSSVRKIGPFGFDMPIALNSQNGAITYYVGADSAAPNVDIAGEYDATTGLAALDAVSNSAVKTTYPTLRANLQGGTKVKRLAAAFSKSGKERVNIGYLGHSIIAGYASDGTTGTAAANTIAWRSKSLPGAVARALNAAYGGSTGYGIETFATGGPASFFTLGGGSVVTGPYLSTGPGGYALGLANSGQTCSFTAQGTAARIYGYGSAVGIVPRWSAPSISGGATQNASAVTNLPTPIGTTYWHTYDITGLTPGETVTLIGATSGTVAIFAVDPDLKSTAGLTLHRAAVPGYAGMQTMSAYLDSTDVSPPGNWINNGANYRLTQAQSITTRLDLEGGVIVTFDVNDLKMFADSLAGTAWGITLEGHKRQLRNLITYLDSIGLDTVLAFGPIRNPAGRITDGVPYDQDELIAAQASVCDEFDCAAYLDITKDFAGTTIDDRYTAQQASGFIYDTVHPNESGCDLFGGARIGRALINAVS